MSEAEQAPRRGAAVSWEAFLGTYLPALVLALGTGIAVPALPTLAKSFGVSFGIASGVLTVFMLGNVAGTVPSGWLIDRFGRRPVLFAGPILTAATALLVAFSHSFTELLILRFLNGLAAQMWVMARLAAISHGAAASERGRLVSWMFGMDTTGRLAGPVVGGFIAAVWGVRAPFVMYAVLALLALVPTVLFAEDTPRRGGDEKRPAPLPASRILRVIVMPRLTYFAVSLFAGLTRGPIVADLPYLYAAFAYHLGPQQIGYLATGATIVAWPIGFLAGWMMDRFGRKWTMVPGFGGVGIAMATLAASAFLHLSYAWFVPLFMIGVALQALTGGSIQTVGADVAPPEARGTFLGLWSFTGQFAMTLSPFVFALLADHVSYGASFLFTAVSGVVVSFLLISAIPETRASK
jgi:MFS family permease